MTDIHSELPQQIETAQDHDQVMKLISKRNKPNAILRLLMNTFESYRQARKIGWSRPWNKIGLNNFQSFRVNKKSNPELINLANNIIKNECPQIPIEAIEFVDSLINSEQPLMGFIFVHELEENGQYYEGATLSLGRVNNKRFRDRLDIILESSIQGNVSQGFDRMRIFVDPYLGNKAPLWTTQIDTPSGTASHELFNQLAKDSNEWQEIPEKHWNHWTSDYIDYFGPRQQYLQNPIFHQDEMIKVSNG